ncbi:MAG: heavy metal-binding domain-containing protein [Acidimicrobiales bacterium]
MAKDKVVQDDEQLAPGEQQAVESLDPGSIGLPQDALSRLAVLGGRDGKAGLFTSDLSVNEFLLVKEAGFNPKGLVFGSSIYHIGLQGRSWSKNRELEKLSQAMYTARELAMSRMEAEAKVLDADGVVGVRLDVNFYEWGAHSAEFIAIGTAIESKDHPMSWRNPLGAPFTSDLSGQDFWTLVQSGYMPLGLVMGTCVYHVGHRNVGNVIAQTSNNSELVPFTQALYEARELAMTRMQDEAQRLGAEGIVGVQMVEKSHFWGSHVIEFFAVGTAIRPIRDNHIIEKPQMMLSLDR